WRLDCGPLAHMDEPSDIELQVHDFDLSLVGQMADTGLANVGKYRILDLVGEGAMGVVYRGVDTVLNRTVAIKVMSEAVSRQQELRDRFLREAQSAGSLQHPNVVTIYDFGEMEGHLFIAMEFVDGVDLERLLATHEPLSIQQRLDIAIDVLTGLSYAHRHGIVHRDVKPANIRVTEDGRAKIMDFGVAYLDSSRLTQTGAMMGTPSYMAPEQVVGAKITPVTDVFAMGSVLYELLTGARPFEGNTLHNTLYKIVSEEPLPILQLMPGLPPALDRIVRRALSKEPSDRHQSALEMADDLAAVRAELDTEHTSSSTVSLRRSMESAIASRLRSRLHRRALAVGGAALFLVVAGVGLWLSSESTVPPAPLVVAERPAEESSLNNPAVLLAADSSALEDTLSGSIAADSPGASSTPAATPSTAGTATRPVVRVPPQRQPSAQRTATPPSAQALSESSAAGDVDSAVPAQRQIAEAPIQLPRADVNIPPSPPARIPDVVAPVVSDTTLIRQTVAGYARAIESRDIAAVRTVYPAITPQQQLRFQTFFDATRSLHVTFGIANLTIDGDAAEARLTGTYDYETERGRSEDPVSFTASLRRESTGWRLISVR
ncbi:MAG TPA: protein kinase, partial [Gemmatimonadaceae bacterium]|nr:protein kinase [Gemmatimonadaceae bacterium]